MAQQVNGYSNSYGHQCLFCSFIGIYIIWENQQRPSPDLLFYVVMLSHVVVLTSLVTNAAQNISLLQEVLRKQK